MGSGLRAWCVGFVLAGMVGESADTPLRRVSTRRIAQLTGTNRAEQRELGITGTDLGVSFVEPGAGGDRLVFLFGDAWTPGRARNDEDSAAWARVTPIPDADRPPVLEWFRGGSKPGEERSFTRLRLPDVSQDGMEVPVEGLVIGNRRYVFTSSGWDPKRKIHTLSALAHCDGPLRPDQLEVDHVARTERFVNVSCVRDGSTIWIFGTGPYRKSAIHLARVQADRLAQRDRWQYVSGLGDGGPELSDDELDAVPVVATPSAGELSVRAVPGLGYVLLYNAAESVSEPRGILARHASRPWGPWSAPLVVFAPEDGYGRMMHAAYDESARGGTVAHDDGLSEPGLHDFLGGGARERWREGIWGGEYGPYLVEPWCRRLDAERWSLVYTLSTWVPYQVHLLETIVTRSEADRPTEALPQEPPVLANASFESGDTSGWSASGDPVVVFRDGRGRTWVTTYTSGERDSATGELAQEFTVSPATKELRFLVHGGEGRVELEHEGRLLRSTRGRSGHAPRNQAEREGERDTLVVWNLEEYAGRRLRVVIRDDVTGPWGFVGATGFGFVSR